MIHYIRSMYKYIAIIILLTTAYYFYTQRTIVVDNVVVSAKMQQADFINKTIIIQPFAGVKRHNLEIIKILFAKLYQIDVIFLENCKIPTKSYLPELKKYDFAIINDFLYKKKLTTKCFRLFGVIEEDATNGDYEYLLGMASLSREVATISLKRLRESYYQRPSNDHLFKTRLCKLILHEYAHTLYMLHCNSNCLMQFTPQIELFDQKPIGLCWCCTRNIRIHAKFIIEEHPFRQRRALKK